MSAQTFNLITNGLTLCAPVIILAFGNINSLFNLITFTSKELRTNPCGWYFLTSAITDLCFVNFGLITKYANEQLGSQLYRTSRSYCRIRIFLTWTLPCISTSYLVLAALDRCLSTSANTRHRSFSRIRIARRLTIIPIILYSLTTSHQFFYFDLRPKCSAQPGGYSIFISLYSIIWTSLVPQSLLLTFGIITYRNIRSSRKRLARPDEQHRSRTDIHLIRITLVQVLSSSILLNIRTAYYAYTVLSTDLPKSDRQKAFENLILEISSSVFYINFCKSFYINTLTSKLFRQVLLKRLRHCFNRIMPRKFRIHPITTNNGQVTNLNKTTS